MVRKKGSSSSNSDKNFDELDESLDFEPAESTIPDDTNSVSGDFYPSVSHRSEMLPVAVDHSSDNRHQEYIIRKGIVASTLVHLDSSSDDENESDADSVPMTAEEESKYLETSEDEETDSMKWKNNKFFEDKLVRYCSNNLDIRIKINTKQNTNNLVTENFNNSSQVDNNLENNTEKTTQRSKKTFVLQRGTKRKIPETQRKHPVTWDLSLINNGNSPQLFLEDIGYLENSKDLEQIVSVSMLPITNTIFKIPYPPAKRPPSRPKKNKCTLDNAEDNEENFSTREDDEISIAASTIVGIDNETLEHRVNEQNISQVPSLEFEKEPHSLLEKDRFTKDWVANTVSTSPNSHEQVLIENYIISFRPPATDTGKNRTNFRNVPVIFNGLCYHFFFSNNCLKPRCRKLHSVIKDKMTMKLELLSKEDLLKTYLFTLPFKQLYKDAYECFLVAFAHNMMQAEIVECIKHLFDKDLQIRTTEAVTLVMQNLYKTGLDQRAAVEMIMQRISFDNYPELAEILMDSVSRIFDIEISWELIKKILGYTGTIAPNVVKRLVQRVTSHLPMNKTLCLDLYNVIIRDNKTDVALIDKTILQPLKTLVCFNGNTNQQILTTAITPSATVSKPTETHSDQLDVLIDRQLYRERTRFEDLQQNNNRNSSVHTPARTVFNLGKIVTSFSAPSHNSSHSDQRSLEDYESNDPGPNHCNDPDPYRCNESVVSSDSLSNYQYIPQFINSNRSQYHFKNITSMFPEKPIIGSTKYSNHFVVDISLHYLLPHSPRHQVSINEKDIIGLNNAIQLGDGATFLKLLHSNKNAATIQDFISMTIVHLKKYKGHLLEGFRQIVNSVASCDPHFDSDLYVKVVFEVIVMNLLLEFEKTIQWVEAIYLIKMFCDWDSLVSSQIFGPKKISLMGRYIFLAKMLLRGKECLYAYEILTNPGLRLLESPANWPLFHVNEDLDYRNSVLNIIFKTAYEYNIRIVLELYKKNIYNYGLIYFNPMVISLLEAKNNESLSYIYGNIQELYMKMDKEVLQKFTLVLLPQLTIKEERIRLYEICCEKEIYVKFSGMEQDVVVRSSMINEELSLILEYFLYKISQLVSYCYTNVTIEIRLPEINKLGTLKHFKSIVRSIRDVNTAVTSILKNRFGIDTDPEEKCTIVTIPVNQIKLFIRSRQEA